MECHLALLELAALGELYLYQHSQGKFCSISGDDELTEGSRGGA